MGNFNFINQKLGYNIQFFNGYIVLVIFGYFMEFLQMFYCKVFSAEFGITEIANI